MGVDCKITLPGSVRLDDVKDVIAALFGVPAAWRDLGTRDGSRYVHNPGAKVTPCGDAWPGGARIIVKNPTGQPLVDGSDAKEFLYHFEWSDGDGTGRGLMPRSRAANIAVGRRLIEFFGGSIDYMDSDDVDVDYSVPTVQPTRPDDGKAWRDFQERKMAVAPLTPEELETAKRWAAYSDD